MMWFTMLSWQRQSMKNRCEASRAVLRWVPDGFLCSDSTPTHETSAQLLLLRLPALLYSRPDSSSAATPHQSYPGPRNTPRLLQPCREPPEYFRAQYLPPRTPFLSAWSPKSWAGWPKKQGGLWPAGQLSVGSMGAGASSTASGPHPSQPSKPTPNPPQAILLNPLGFSAILPQTILSTFLIFLVGQRYLVYLTIVRPAISIDQPHISFILSATYCCSSKLILVKNSFSTFVVTFDNVSAFTNNSIWFLFKYLTYRSKNA